MGEIPGKNQEPQSINIWLESLKSSATSEDEPSDAHMAAAAQKDEAILALLARLALVYWRPDFTPGQAKQLYSQYLEDLRGFAFADIVDAFKKYRQNGENRFYPTPGQLVDIITTVPKWETAPRSRYIAEKRAAAVIEIRQLVDGARLQLTAAAE